MIISGILSIGFYVVLCIMLCNFVTCEAKVRRPHEATAVSFTVPPYSLSTACSAEIRKWCEFRTPYQIEAVNCFEAHKNELSKTCLSWHNARISCQSQIDEKVSKNECNEVCMRHCGSGKSLLLCMRVLARSIRSVTDKSCYSSDFAKSIVRSLNLKDDR
eukprot:GILI01025749.1.p1 GENE.GILI01025749.1~~GILI01025749.1.p1  ORF type:complete len:160 (+),score=10.40 GILI01025749.1:39-518(+)